jgi:FKBP-type peptidyl-prolyl cis-trans isomerase FkpA
MHRFIAALMICLLAIPAFAADKSKTEEQKTLYAIGLVLSRSLSIFNLSPDELEFVKEGMTDAVTGKKLVVNLDEYNGKVQEMARLRRKALGDKSAAAGNAYLEKVAAEKGSVKTSSGLVYLSLKEGTGANPGPQDMVTVSYSGTLPDGKVFDSSYKRGKPTEFRMDGVIKCWTEGLQMMKAGGKAKLVCPASLAYGDAGAGDAILPGATLVFEVDLLEVKPEAKK